MKKIRSILFCIVLVSAPFIFGAATCTPTQERQTYNTLYSLETTTTAAYDGYVRLVIAGQLSTNGLHEVSRNYDNFQTVMEAAIIAARGNTNAPAPFSVQAASDTVIGSITAAKAKGK